MQSDLNITLLTRTISTAKFPTGAKVIASDFSLESLTSAFKGQDAVISCIPIVALGEQAVVIEAAIVAGVKRFIPSEYGSDSSVGTTSPCMSLFTVKFQTLTDFRYSEPCSHRSSSILRRQTEVF